MLLLAIVEGLARAGEVQWLKLGILAGGACCAINDLRRPRIMRRARPRVDQLSTRHASLIVALVVCLFLSWLSAKIGMAAIIGAFFAGMIFADHAVDWDLLPRVHAITEFLGPFFFFSIGAQLNARLFSGDVLVAAIVVTVLAILSKVVGCGLPVMKDGWHTALAVGVGMMPRGEVALIIALVGLNSQIVTQSTYAIVVFMTAITTLLAPPALRYLFRNEQSSAAAH